MLYAVACEFEGRLQIADTRVTGVRPPRPSDLLTDWLADIIAARFADDTQNICVLSGFHTLLDNNSLWCMGTGGGTQVVKQEMTTRGSRRGDPHPWYGSSTASHPATWVPAAENPELESLPLVTDVSNRTRSRTVFRWANTSVTMLGAQDRARALPGAKHLVGWKHTDDDPAHPSQAQLDALHEEETYGKIKATVLTNLRMLAAQHELTIHARKQALLTLVWSNVWFIVEYEPPAEDDEWLLMLTEASYRYLLQGNVDKITNACTAATVRNSYSRHMKESAISAHPHDGGLGFPHPAHCVRQILCTLVLKLLEPYGANTPYPTGTAWNSQPLAWMMRAAGAPDSATLGELIDADWEAILHALERGRAPTRWIRTAQAWGKLMEHVTVLAPQTYEQLLSCPCVVNGEHCTIGDAWDGQEAAWKDTRPAGVTGDHIALLQGGATQYQAGDWALIRTVPLQLLEDEHLATGTRHYLHGCLVRLDREHQAHGAWTVQVYLHTCNGWTFMGRGHALTQCLWHATVEPWPGNQEELPVEVVLVGPTTTHWAQSRGRLQWTRNSADPHPYYDSLVSADSSSIRACWNQERQGEPRPQPRMTTLALKLHREDEVVGIGHCFEIITTAPWSAKLSTFAWRLVAGVLPVGKATGRKMAPEFDALDDTCMLCDSQGAGDTIEHVFGCCGTLQPLRDWVKRALDVTAGWAPPWGHGELLHLVYGRKSNTPTDTTVRGVALDVIRALRAARISNAHRRATNYRRQQDIERALPNPSADQVRAALRARLTAAIMMEWRAAKGVGRSTDGRAQKTRPRNEAEFLDRWGALAEIEGGRCITHTQRLEPSGSGQSP